MRRKNNTIPASRRSSTEDVLEAKRRFLVAIDDLRIAPPEESQDTTEANETARLRQRIKATEAARRALEEKIRVLEHRALSAIAEVGRLHRALDETVATHEGDRFETRWRHETRELHRGLEAAQLERSLLTSVLSDSESELTRMASTINIMACKLETSR